MEINVGLSEVEIMMESLFDKRDQLIEEEKELVNSNAKQDEIRSVLCKRVILHGLIIKLEREIEEERKKEAEELQKLGKRWIDPSIQRRFETEEDVHI